MSTLKFTMTEQMILARALGEEKAKSEKRLAQSEEANLPHSIEGDKGRLKDLQGIVHKLFEAISEESPYAARAFVSDLEHHYNWTVSYQFGETVNA